MDTMQVASTFSRSSSSNRDDSNAIENHNPTIQQTNAMEGTENAGAGSKRPPVLQGWDRFLTRGPHAVGKMGVLSLGHTNVVEAGRGDAETPWMDEHAVRIRAGLLNVLAWTSLLNVFFIREPKMAYSIMSLAMWEFFASCSFGLTPLAPLGVLGTLGSMILYREALWVPARPKRFAWTLGLIMVICCMVFWRIGWENGFEQKHAEMMEMMGHHHRRALQGDTDMSHHSGHGMADNEMNVTTTEIMDDGMAEGMHQNTQADGIHVMGMGCEMFDMDDLSEYPVAAKFMIAIKFVVITCLVLTWLESSCGWCMGCAIYKVIWNVPKQRASLMTKKDDNGGKEDEDETKRSFYCDPSSRTCEVCEWI